MSQKQLGEIVSNEHISARDGENINAKRIGLYGYDYAGGQWRRLAVNSSGSLLSGTVTSITGTANQVLANGTSGSAQTGAVTLTTPQNIHTAATPTFAGLTLNSTTVGLTAEVTGFNAVNAGRFIIDSSDNSTVGAIYASNDTNFAHSGFIGKFEAKNATDSGPILSLVNAGSGNYITADSVFTVTKAGNITGSGATLSGLTASLPVVTDGSKNLTSMSYNTFASNIDHGLLTGLSADDHTQYALLAGRGGGQTLIGGTASGEDLTLRSTAHATKGSIFLGSSSLFELAETSGRLSLPTTGSGAGIVVGGDATMYRSAANRILFSNTQIYNTRGYGTVAGSSGILDVTNFDGSIASDGVGGSPSLRALQFTITASGTNNLTDLQAISGNTWISGTAGSVAAVALMSGNVRVNNAMAITTAYGYRATVIMSSTGNISNYRAFEARSNSKSSTGTITGTAIGFYADNQGLAGMTSSIGMQIATQSGATNNIGLYFAGTSATVADGIRFNDVDMFRRTTNILTLGSGDSFEVPANLAVGTTVGSSQLDVNLDVRARQLIADGDNAGVASTTSITNVTDGLDQSVVSFATRTGNPTATHQGYIKIYVGTTAYYVPYVN